MDRPQPPPLEQRGLAAQLAAAARLRDQWTLGHGRPSGAAKLAFPLMEWDFMCGHCRKPFDLSAAKVGYRTMPNTLTDLPDSGDPWVECPHCGFIN